MSKHVDSRQIFMYLHPHWLSEDSLYHTTNTQDQPSKSVTSTCTVLTALKDVMNLRHCTWSVDILNMSEMHVSTLAIPSFLKKFPLYQLWHSDQIVCRFTIPDVLTTLHIIALLARTHEYRHIHPWRQLIFQELRRMYHFPASQTLSASQKIPCSLNMLPCC